MLSCICGRKKNSPVGQRDKSQNNKSKHSQGKPKRFKSPSEGKGPVKSPRPKSPDGGKGKGRTPSPSPSFHSLDDDDSGTSPSSARSRKSKNKKKGKSKSGAGAAGRLGAPPVSSSLTADEMIEAYDKMYLAAYPDLRLKSVTASHQHLRHWHYGPKTEEYKPRTSHEFQWLAEHGGPSHPPAPRTGNFVSLSKASPSSLHKMFVHHRDQAASVSQGHQQEQSAPVRDSLLKIASSPDYTDPETHLSKSAPNSPTRTEIIRMLHDEHDPTIHGIRHSSQSIRRP